MDTWPQRGAHHRTRARLTGPGRPGTQSMPCQSNASMSRSAFAPPESGMGSGIGSDEASAWGGDGGSNASMSRSTLLLPGWAKTPPGAVTGVAGGCGGGRRRRGRRRGRRRRWRREAEALARVDVRGVGELSPPPRGQLAPVARGAMRHGEVRAPQVESVVVDPVVTVLVVHVRHVTIRGFQSGVPVASAYTILEYARRRVVSADRRPVHNGGLAYRQSAGGHRVAVRLVPVGLPRLVVRVLARAVLVWVVLARRRRRRRRKVCLVVSLRWVVQDVAPGVR